jgi:hypothetical protein
MVWHVVLFRLRTDLAQTEREAFVHALERALRDIPTIRGFRIGRRVTVGAGYEEGLPDYQFCGVIEFDDLAGLRAYLDHPLHEDVGARFNTSIEKALVYDYEMGGPEQARTLLWGRDVSTSART